MLTGLNEQLEQFFKMYQFDEINFENIDNFLKDIHMQNEYGNLLHAAVHQKFDEDKVLKFIQLLLENGVDVNNKGKETGYTFIHLALYGYTEDDKDYSYTTDFIIKLIELAKKYGFNVQSVDNDQDSIVHTALASEVYEGKTVPIIKALGDHYDVLCKDQNKNNIYEALLEYKKEASENHNDKWYNRLLSEEQAIRQIVEIHSYSLDQINQKLEQIKTKIESEIFSINIEYFLSHYSEILKIKNDLEFCLEKQRLFVSNDAEYIDLQLKFNQFLQQLILKYIKEISSQPNYQSINMGTTILESFHYQDELVLLNQVKEKYSDSIENLKLSILNCLNFQQLNEIKKRVEQILDSEIQNQLLTSYEEKCQQFEEIIQKIQLLETRINSTNHWMNQENNKEKINYNSLGFKQLEELELNYKKDLEDNKSKISQQIEKQLDSLLKSAFSLADEHVFSEEELWNIIHTNIDKHQSKSNQKSKKKGKK